MLIRISAITAIWILLDIIDVSVGRNEDEALDIMFRQRSRSDWEKVWHKENHSRCRDKLIRHLYWACEKDIYRLSRRSSSPPSQMHQLNIIKNNTNNNNNNLIYNEKRSLTMSSWFGNYLTQKIMLRTRRSRRRASSDGSITAECCTQVGCTWEEYAEYCPSNKRFF